MAFYSFSTVSQIDLIETFEIYDQNKDGFIDEQDLCAVLSQLGQDTSPDKIKMIMEAADLDKDGHINLNEFIMHMKNNFSIEEGEVQETLKDIFNIFKQTESGRICIEDLRQCVCRMGESLSQKEFNEMINDYDLGHDGFISFSEFYRLINQ